MGDGTEESPYLIQSAYDWDALSEHINGGGTNYNGAYFKLTDDITVSTMLGTRPGNRDDEDRPFIGTFDGGFPADLCYDSTRRFSEASGKAVL